MSLSRTKSPPFGVGAKLQSSEINAIDQNIENALDKRSGQTDALGSVVTCTANTAARVIPTHKPSADADTTYAVADGISVIRIGILTADRIYTLSNTGAASGDRVHLYNDDPTYSITVKANGGATLFKAGIETNTDNDGNYAEFLFSVGAWFLVTYSRGSRDRTQTFSGSGSWTCPRGVTSVILDGYGAGGGGGGGANQAANATNVWSGGGAGGGGAARSQRRVAVTPGVTYTVTIGAAGSGGAAGASGGHGGDTIFANGGTQVAVFPGAQGGRAGQTSALSGLAHGFVSGGSWNRNSPQPPPGLGIFNIGGLLQIPYTQPPPGQGGIGPIGDVIGNPNVAFMVAGTPNNVSGFHSLGGAGGAMGTTAGTLKGGDGGGGGGGGPLEGATSTAAGAGGAGGNSSGTNGASTLGSAGGSVGANSGAGGGGGGGGGTDPTTGRNGGAGGTGGSGRLIVSWVK